MSIERYHRRVVITGLGVMAPNGCNLREFWRTIRGGISAAGPITRFDTSKVPNKIACEIKDFNHEPYMDAKKSRRFERSIQYGIAASVQAVRDAAIDFRDEWHMGNRRHSCRCFRSFLAFRTFLHCG